MTATQDFTAIVAADNGSHEMPADPSPYWQESCFFWWYDPVSRAGGYSHFSFYRAQGRAEISHWLTLDGVVIDNYMHLDDPLPEGDIGNFTAGPITVASPDPLKTYLLNMVGPPGSGITVDCQFDALTPGPFGLSLDAADTEVGDGHFDTHGRVTGRMVVGDRIIEINAFARYDHSWGPRDIRPMLSYRFACLGFDQDLFVSLYTFESMTGRKDYGFVHDAGAYHTVRAVTFDSRIADDGSTPLGATVRAWTDDGRGYSFTCDSLDATCLTALSHDIFCTDGFGVWQSGGRRGAGLFQIGERRSLNPSQRAQLSMKP